MAREDAKDAAASTSRPTGSPFEDVGCGVSFDESVQWVDTTPVNAPSAGRTSGGALVSGVYVLTSATVYNDGSGSERRREVLELKGSAGDGTFTRATEVEAAFGDFVKSPAGGATGTYSVLGAHLWLDPKCPNGFMDTGAYFTDGHTLTIVSGRDHVERVYTRVR